MMEKEIIINGQKLKYLSRRYRRSRNLRLAIGSDGRLVASKPWYASERMLQDFITERAEWVLEKLEAFRSKNGNKTPADRRAEYLIHKERARDLILDKLEEFNRFYQFSFKSVSIRNQTSRWGSCSATGSLNFNYKLVLLPEPLLDYVVVHELCHLKEPNHSIRFWRLVEQKIPDHKVLRKELRKR
jgi:predicted metal-dependent hydrolase